MEGANLLWTKERVLKLVRERQRKGLSVNSAQIMDLDRNLYAAGRRRFGSWAETLEAASKGTAPVTRHQRSSRPRKRK